MSDFNRDPDCDPPSRPFILPERMEDDNEEVPESLEGIIERGPSL